MWKSYLTVKKLVNQSGWGWDDEQKIAVAPADVWDTYVAVRSCFCICDTGFLIITGTPGGQEVAKHAISPL